MKWVWNEKIFLKLFFKIRIVYKTGWIYLEYTLEYIIEEKDKAAN